VIGLLVVALPLIGYLVLRSDGRGPKPKPPATAPAPSTPAAAPPTFPIDDAAFPPSGMSVPDEEGPIDPAALRRALERTEGWLDRFQIDPFGGVGTDSLRLFTLQIESFHRLWWSERDPARRAARGERVRAMLERALAADRLRETLRMQGSTQGVYEIILLCARGEEHGVDVAPVLPVIRSILPILQTEIDRMPPSAAAMYVSALGRIGIDAQRPIARYRSSGILSKRPREVNMSLRDIYALTQEILAYTDGGVAPLEGLSPDERRYLARVLPYFAMAYTLFRRSELVGDLLSCLSGAELKETYGYREAMRTLLARQNPDGSFGELPEESAGGSDNPSQRLAATASCVTALCIERKSAGEGS